MTNFKEIALKSLSVAPFSLIGDSWMLISSGTEQKYNMMTASWGGFGILWNKPVAFIFVRPQRYTFEFLENNDYFSLSFYDEGYRDALTLCGTKSGRDINKTEAIKFNPIFDQEAPYFEQANLVFICKKIYGQLINPEGFIEKNIKMNYINADYHKIYVAEVVKGLEKT